MIYSIQDKTKKELVEICKIQIEEYQLLNKRIAELEFTLINVRDLLNEQEDKSCLGTGYPANAYECAPWPIVDEVINDITNKLLAKGGAE